MNIKELTNDELVKTLLATHSSVEHYYNLRMSCGTERTKEYLYWDNKYIISVQELCLLQDEVLRRMNHG